MSCWVVPTVAAEYWGISLDDVWRRVDQGLIPHKLDGGFFVVDVDPWTADAAAGVQQHLPPATFLRSFQSPEPFDSALALLQDAAACLSPAASLDRPETRAASLVSSEWEQEEPEEAIASEEEHSEDVESPEELPELDEAEEATFGRLSWQEVRQQVSRTRRPPRAANR